MQTEESAGGGGTSSEQNFEEEMMKLMQDAQEELKKDEEGLKRDAELAVRLAKLNTKTSGTLVKNITNHCGIIITESKWSFKTFLRIVNLGEKNYEFTPQLLL